MEDPQPLSADWLKARSKKIKEARFNYERECVAFILQKSIPVIEEMAEQLKKDMTFQLTLPDRPSPNVYADLRDVIRVASDRLRVSGSQGFVLTCQTDLYNINLSLAESKQGASLNFKLMVCDITNFRE